MDIFQKALDFTEARTARESGYYPYFRVIESESDSSVFVDGRELVMLGSNNYLGLTTHPHVRERAAEALAAYGTSCTGSRLLNGNLDIHEELEERLARFVGKERALVFSTGFGANIGTISAIAGRHDTVVIDKDDHASIYDGCKLSYGAMLRYRHNDMEDLEKKLQSVPDSAGKLIVTDGVFSMGGDIANLPEIVRLAKKYGARTLVDDAHGLGVLGEGGRGTASHFGLTDEVDITMGTFSKSLASIGGFMAASGEVAEYVRHASRPFIFCASIPPASAATAAEALRILTEQPELPERLAALSAHMRTNLKKAGIAIRESTTPIIPIYTYEMENTLRAAKALYDAGVYVNPVLPPATHPSECLLRTSYMATHTEALLDEALDIIREVLPKYVER